MPMPTLLQTTWYGGHRKYGLAISMEKNDMQVAVCQVVGITFYSISVPLGLENKRHLWP